MKKAVFVIFLLFSVMALFGEEFLISKDKEVRIGSLKSKGYEIVVEKNTFTEDAVLIAENKICNDDNISLTESIELKLKGKENEFISFRRPIKISIRIADVSNPQNYLFVSYLNNKPIYYLPDSVNITEKYVSFSVNYLGLWACGKGSKETVINTVADYVLLRDYSVEKKLKNYIKETKTPFENMLLSFDITDVNSQKIFVDDFFTVINSGNCSSTVDFLLSDVLNNKDQNKLFKSIDSTVAWQICRVLQRNSLIDGIPYIYLGKLKDTASYIAGSNLNTGHDVLLKELGRCSEKNAFYNSIADVIRRENSDLTSLLTEMDLKTVTDLYFGRGIDFPNSENMKRNTDNLLKYLNPSEKTDLYLVENYAHAMGFKEKDMTETSKQRLLTQFKKDLEYYLEDMAFLNEYYNREKAKAYDFVSELYRLNLLSSVGKEKIFKDEKKFSIKLRIKKNYNVRTAISVICGSDRAENMDAAEMASLILAYIQAYDGYDNLKFYSYLAQKDYVKKAEGYDKKHYEKNTSSGSSSDYDRTGGFFGVLGDLIDIFSDDRHRTARGKRLQGAYNLIDVDYTRGPFKSRDGSFTYDRNGFRTYIEISSLPTHLKPGESYSVRLVIENDKIPNEIGNNADFSVRLRSNDVSFNRYKLENSTTGFRKKEDTVTMFVNSYTPANGSLLKITADATGPDGTSSITYIYEYNR